MWPSKSEDYQNYTVTSLFSGIDTILFYEANIKTFGRPDIKCFKEMLEYVVLKFPSIYADDFARKGSKRLGKE